MVRYFSLVVLFMHAGIWARPAFAGKHSLVDSYWRADCEVWSAFLFCGEQRHAETLQEWLSLIQETEIGEGVLNEISRSPHRLLIRHSASSVNSGGKALSPLTSRLSNGIGEEVVIEMNFEMPLQGSHRVRAVGSWELIPFRADQNLFHELVHAKHKLSGSLEISGIERQAIREENIYRQQSDPVPGAPLRDWRAYEDGVQVWFPDEGMDEAVYSQLSLRPEAL